MGWKLDWKKPVASLLTSALLSVQVLGGALGGTAAAAPAAANSAEDIEVHLLGINDLHGQLDTISTVSDKPAGTAAILAAYLKEARAKYKHSLLFHNGDAVGASAPISSLERDKPTLEWMNMMGFDVGSLGNHEFDQGVEALMAQLKGGVDPKNEKVTHDGVDFNYVNANVVDEKTGKPIIDPYTIKEVGGIKIGFIGLVTKSTPSKVSPAGTAGVRFLTAEEEVQAVEGYAKELQQQGVESIIVLAHDPATTREGETTGEAADLARALPANSPIDVIVAGDNHGYANGEVNGKLVVQAYSYGTAFEDIKLVIDPVTHDVKSKSAVVTTTFHEGVTPDADTVALVNKYLEKHPELTQPIGTTDGSITRTDAYNQESALGNLIADAMRSADFEDGEGPADFAFMNPGGIRADLPKGDVTFGDIAKIQPFGNTLVKLTLTGEQIRTLLKQQWGVKADGTADTKTLQISGMKYTANLSLPIEQRIISLAKADGTPISPKQEYTAVVNNFMAAGGDNYKVLTEAKESVPGPIDLDVFYDYIVNTFKGGEIKAGIEGRITNNPAAPEQPNPGPNPQPQPEAVFTDLDGVVWAQPAIQKLFSQGFIKGVSKDQYAPERNISRAEFAAMLVRVLNETGSGTSSVFKDVEAGSWYAEAVSIAANAGWVNGSGNGRFEPGREITREEMAIMAANALQGKDVLSTIDKDVELKGFADRGEITSYAEVSFAQLISAGILGGVAEGKLAPKGMASRAQAAVIMSRILDRVS
ncbi:5'-nucleotidase C-terminal domain-containing protein [Paenibacillus lemnae]|uniref:SLH domain-containing protein n=1 Tax=Paenibacillus lemnae TaxID=1330551 RepID=A0A848MBS3_PAELE|nr:5'-nucleotidase C-terminal domain-containing protein [Paenibacillus lemnae]NMO97600.1 hypothetical protein [Paenibacillus lemnae]